MENSFVGSLQLQDHPNPDMTIIDIWNNNMRDQVPKNICLIFPNIWTLKMAKNELTGFIPSRLEKNKLSGRFRFIQQSIVYSKTVSVDSIMVSPTVKQQSRVE